MDNQGVSILVVDDEFSVRDSLYNWFKNEGYRVDTAENGMEALKKLQEGPWDIALVDIKMPGMNGMELQSPHKGSEALFWKEQNWQPLCKFHHDQKTANEDGGFIRVM